MSSDSEQRFSEEEVGQILRRAAETNPGRGMTIAELEAVASEAGLDVALVRRAATDLRARVEPSSAPPDGAFGPTTLTQERRVEGRLDASAWDELVAQIRRQLKVEGSVEHLGRELAWSSRASSGREIHVQVTPRRGHTSIRVHERTNRLALRLYLGLMGGLFAPALMFISIFCVEALGAPALIPVLMVAWVYGCYRLAQAIYRTKLAARRFELDALATSLAEAGADLVALPPGKPGDE